MRQLIKNVLDVETRPFTSTVTYTIKAMFDVKNDDGTADISFEPVDKISMSFARIDRLGGPHEVLRQIKEQYNIED